MDDPNRQRARRVEVVAGAYKRWISPGLHVLGGSLLPMRGGCRYHPTCSEYAAVAVARHGWLRGMRLAGWRLLRCHPWSRGGFDPVP
ncbi:MAG: membrane protein insertion efficiency factor YidD [Acidobacteriaceae bacterium]